MAYYFSTHHLSSSATAPWIYHHTGSFTLARSCSSPCLPQLVLGDHVMGLRCQASWACPIRRTWPCHRQSVSKFTPCLVPKTTRGTSTLLIVFSMLLLVQHATSASWALLYPHTARTGLYISRWCLSRQTLSTINNTSMSGF